MTKAASAGINTQGQCFSLDDYYKLYYSPKGGLVDPLPSAESLGCSNEAENYFFIDGIHGTNTGYRFVAKELVPELAAVIRSTYGLSKD